MPGSHCKRISNRNLDPLYKESTAQLFFKVFLALHPAQMRGMEGARRNYFYERH